MRKIIRLRGTDVKFTFDPNRVEEFLAQVGRCSVLRSARSQARHYHQSQLAFVWDVLHPLRRHLDDPAFKIAAEQRAKQDKERLCDPESVILRALMGYQDEYRGIQSPNEFERAKQSARREESEDRAAIRWFKAMRFTPDEVWALVGKPGEGVRIWGDRYRAMSRGFPMLRRGQGEAIAGRRCLAIVWYDRAGPNRNVTQVEYLTPLERVRKRLSRPARARVAEVRRLGIDPLPSPASD